jgi:hypothetical protein
VAATTLEATFIPILPGTYTFELMVTANGVSKTSETVVTVNDFSIQLNVPQIVNIGEKVNLVSSIVGDVIPLNYEWTVVSSPTALTLVDANSAVANFTATVDGTYQLKLKVTYGSGPSAIVKEFSTFVIVNGFNLITTPLEYVSNLLDAIFLNVTVDTNIVGATYQWTQVSGNPVIILNSNSANASFLMVPDILFGNNTYEFMVTVTVGNVTKTARKTVIYSVAASL